MSWSWTISSSPPPKPRNSSRSSSALQLKGTALIVVHGDEPNLRLASRNVPHVELTTGEALNTYQVLRRDKLVFSLAAPSRPWRNVSTANNMNTFTAIKTVRVTEKGTRQSDQLNQYTVVADPPANKLQIRQAVQELFKVKVLKVNTLNVRGKARRSRTPIAGQAPNWKKAIVTLAKDDKIRLDLRPPFYASKIL